MTFLLYALSIGYWYCLPFLTISIFDYNEIKLYDFLLAIILIVLITKFRKELPQFFVVDGVGKALIQFSLWASFMSIFTISMALISLKISFVFQILLYLFHLWGFVLAYAGFRMFVTTKNQVHLFLDTFLIIGLIEGIIISLQLVEVIPTFWNQRYTDAYGAFHSATLAPNPTMPGHILVMTLAAAISYLNNVDLIGKKRAILAIFTAVISILSTIATGSRTAWVVGVIFLIASFFTRRIKLGLLLVFLLFSLLAGQIVPQRYTDGLLSVLNGRFFNKIQYAQNDSILSKFDTVDNGRLNLWSGGIQEILSVPWVIPFGSGFINYRNTIAVGQSAHSMYITLIGELGLVGLFLYLKWLIRILKEFLIPKKPQSNEYTVRRYSPFDGGILTIAMMVGLIAGEVLYVYRPSYSALGIFLFLIAMMKNSALVFEETQTHENFKKFKYR